MNIKILAEKYEEYIIGRRRYYHTCPEISGQEVNTTTQLKVEEETGLSYSGEPL